MNPETILAKPAPYLNQAAPRFAHQHGLHISMIKTADSQACTKVVSS